MFKHHSIYYSQEYIQILFFQISNICCFIPGNTIIEENSNWDRCEEKKLSESDDSHHGVMEEEGMPCGCCSPILKKNNSLPPDPTTGERFKYAFSCPPHGSVSIIYQLL